MGLDRFWDLAEREQCDVRKTGINADGFDVFTSLMTEYVEVNVAWG